MQTVTAAHDIIHRTAARLTRAARIELVSRSDPNDVREVIDTRDRDYDPERTGIQDGAINVETAGDVLRRLDLTLFDRSGRWYPDAGRSLWLDAMIRVRRGYEQTTLWPQGVYLVSDPEAAGRGIIRISGVDKTGRANGQPEGGFTDPLEIPKGTNIKAALTAIASTSAWGETMLNLADTTAEMPYTKQWTATDYPWQAFGEVASIPGDYRHYHDETGWLRWHQDPDPLLLAPVRHIWSGQARPATALPGEFSLYISAGKQINSGELRNWVIVRGGGGKTTPVYAEAKDTDTNSPTSVSRIGPRILQWNGGRPDPLITTQAEAQARADYELRRLLQWQERIPLRLKATPYLQPWDVLRITAPDAGLDGNYQAVSYSLSLISDEMSVQGWRPRRSAA